MTILTTEHEGVITITLNNRFVFTDHTHFHQVYNKKPQKTNYIIDFKRVSYMDSAALGMLLVLHEHNGGENKTHIRLTNCNPQIKKIFDVANFGQIFTIQ